MSSCARVGVLRSASTPRRRALSAPALPSARRPAPQPPHVPSPSPPTRQSGRPASRPRVRRSSGAVSVGSSSTARSSLPRADLYCSRASARLPAPVSASAAADAQLLGWSAVQLGEEERRVVEMVGTDLEQFLAGALLEPLREPRVLLCARLLGQPCVRDLPDQHVLEAEGGLAGDRGTLLAKHELAQQQVVEQRLHVEVRGDVRDGALPEDAADDSCSLQQHLGVGRQMVDTSCDERLERVGDAIGSPPSASMRMVSSTNSGLPSVRSSKTLGQGRRIRQVGERAR